MEIRATVDVTEAVTGLNDLQKTHIPFALATSLTGCAREGQRAVQGNLGAKLTLRNSFTRQGIRYKPADKRGMRIEADVHTHTDTPKHPDYMDPQEEGGEKLTWGGHKFIAIPTKYAHQVGGKIIVPELRIGNVMQNLGNVYENTKTVRGLGYKKHQKAIHALVFFLQSLKNGRRAVMARYYDSRDAVPFYLLVPEAHIPPRLGMEQTVQIAVQYAWPAQWEMNWKKIMARGLRITS